MNELFNQAGCQSDRLLTLEIKQYQRFFRYADSCNLSLPKGILQLSTLSLGKVGFPDKEQMQAWQQCVDLLESIELVENKASAEETLENIHHGLLALEHLLIEILA